MFKDELNSNEKIVSGDIVYIYQYQKRKLIRGIADLDKIRVMEVIPGGKTNEPIMVSGYRTKSVQGNDEDERLVGFVVYKQEENLIKTSEGYKVLNYYMNGEEVCLCLKKVKESYSLNFLSVVFQLYKGIELKFRISDVVGLNIENISTFASSLKIEHPRLHMGYISFELNGKEQEVNEFEIFINDNRYEVYNKEENIFKWACINKKSINEKAIFDYQKIFSLKHKGFEIIEI